MNGLKLFTLGHIGRDSGVSFIALERSSRQVDAALTLNGVRYFDEAGRTRIIELAQSRRPTASAPSAIPAEEPATAAAGA